jgi:hypothetical protein
MGVSLRAAPMARDVFTAEDTRAGAWPFSANATVAHLHELWRQREKLRKDQASLQTEKERCGDLLFQSD